MNKDNLQYAFETQQSISDRLTDIIGNLTSQIAVKDSEIQEKKNTIAALGATNRKLKNDLISAWTEYIQMMLKQPT